MKGETPTCRSSHSPWHRTVLHRTRGMNAAEGHWFLAPSLSQRPPQTAASSSSLRHLSLGIQRFPLSQLNWTAHTCRGRQAPLGKAETTVEPAEIPHSHTRWKFHSFQGSTSVPSRNLSEMFHSCFSFLFRPFPKG